MSDQNNSQISNEQALSLELQDAHLVIGRQQVVLLKMQQQLTMYEQRINELEAQTMNEMDAAVTNE